MSEKSVKFADSPKKSSFNNKHVNNDKNVRKW